MKKNKKALVIAISIFLIVIMSVTAVADWDDFSVKLPIASLNTEVSTLTKSSNGTDYFTIEIYDISDGYKVVRGWTEDSTWGTNYSSSMMCHTAGEVRRIAYNTVPENNAKVVLNLDNPVYTDKKPTVTGGWTPN